MDPTQDLTPGAAPADDAVVADQQTQPGSQQAQDQGLELPFRLEDVTDEFNLTGPAAREWLMARQAQFQAGYTRATQTLAQQRAELQGYADWAARLNADDTRTAALKELLNAYGYDLPDADDDDLFDDDDDDQQTQLERRLAAIEAEREAERAEQAEFEATEAFQAQVVADAEHFATQYGFGSVENVPEYVRDDVLARAVVLPRLADGRLDFASAVAGHLAQREAIMAEAQQRAGYLQSKTATSPGVVDGTAGAPITDKSGKEARIQAALAVAGRHL